MYYLEVNYRLYNTLRMKNKSNHGLALEGVSKF